MKFIVTTATAVDKLNRLAKTLRKASGTRMSLAAALDTVAQHQGYEHWRHVTRCLEQTKAARETQPLPDTLALVLDEAAERQAASAQTQQAFAKGFVFAIDAKDAESISPNQAFAECDDGWYLAARNLWPRLIHYRHDETGTTLFEARTEDDLIDIALDDLSNYKLFCHVGADLPSSVPAAYQLVRAVSFFPPTHIWLDGQFVAMDDVPEIQIDGQVVHTVLSGDPVAPISSMSERFERVGHLLSAQERSMLDRMSAAEQESLLQMIERNTPQGQKRFTAVQNEANISRREAKKL
ncbi:hypothetical protein ACSFA0_14655 [Variovorax sp. LT1P1]|uniref:hypothetical protein n=1 Tax=Variovorax sp. LT1P1 TaxID=3443730 RepID=UPI003F46DAFA